MRNRIFAVLAIAILAGGGLAYGTYNMMNNQPVKTVSMPTQPVVVAAANISLGTELKKEDLTVANFPAGQVPEGAPAWPASDGLVKTSAAWLIEHAGFSKGYGDGRVTLSTKHTLALTNRGDATTADLVALAREVRDGVESAFGIRLVNEPTLVGVEL